jgi:hypothetical protein
MMTGYDDDYRYYYRYYCPETSDGEHCGCCYGAQCCACGQYGPEPEDDDGPGEFTPIEEETDGELG